MKIFPIKFEKSIPKAYKFIEWKIHNVCNYNCSFCPSRHKDGSQRWFSIEQYKSYIDKLYDLCDGMPYWIQFTGGEPTLFPKLIELCQYIKSKNGMVSLISNGSRTMRYWEELKQANSIDYLFITLHTEQTKDYKHIQNVINLFHDVPIEVICLITHVKDTIPLAFEAQEHLQKTTGAIITLKAMMIGDYDIYSYYTAEQLARLMKFNWVAGNQRYTKAKSALPDHLKINHTLKVTYNNGASVNLDPQVIMKMKQNRFLDWECEIGKDNMRIDYDIVYRGVCEVGGTRNLNDINLDFTDDFVSCTSKDCFCGTDMIATKYLPEHLYPKS